MEFEEWFKKEKLEAIGELTYDNTDAQTIVRFYEQRKESMKCAWDYRQKEVDELTKYKYDSIKSRISDKEQISELTVKNLKLEQVISRSKEIFEDDIRGAYVNGVYISHEQACIIYSKYLEER